VVARILRAFGADQTRAWFERDLGVALKVEETGKLFPVTDDAKTVLDALLGECARAGVEVRSGARVVRIEREQGAAGAGFHLGIERVTSSAAFGGQVAGTGRVDWPLPAAGPDEWLRASAVVLATGGLSFPRTGSDGTGYALACALGHTLVPPVPALTPLKSDDPLGADLQGLATEAELTLWAGGRVERRERGSLLFTHFGYSGPPALDLSRHWLRAAERAAVLVTMSVVPGGTRAMLEAEWLAGARSPRLTVRRHLAARWPERLAAHLCTEAGVDPATRLAQVPRESRARLLDLLLARPLRVTGTLGYEKAEATAGGVPLAEVDPSTLESRRCPGLYLCGEILDVEGRLGGFNFQWAWSSGTVVGRAAARGAVTD
jgi:predicted flavoprotein YhiN